MSEELKSWSEAERARLIDRIDERDAENHWLKERADALALQADEWEGKYAVVCDLNQRLRAEVEALREALGDMVQAVCGPTGFAAAVREHAQLGYPWPALDQAEAKARAALTRKAPQ
jgi:ferredoxin-NADP reductase